MFRCIVNPTTEDVVHPVNAAVRGGFITMMALVAYLWLREESPALAMLSVIAISYGLHYYSAHKALQRFKESNGTAP